MLRILPAGNALALPMNRKKLRIETLIIETSIIGVFIFEILTFEKCRSGA